MNILYYNILRFCRIVLNDGTGETSEFVAYILLSLLYSFNIYLLYVALFELGYASFNKTTGTYLWASSIIMFCIVNYFSFLYKKKYYKIYLETRKFNNWFYSLLVFIWVLASIYYFFKYFGKVE
jgi:hypothetical protein